jgi:exodeoxyribonuclease VII large subunit
VAQFPIPIITGIGHDRDECVLDMVSHLRVKTPTAAAAFLIDHAQQELDCIDDCQQRIARSALSQLSTLNSQLSALSTRIPTLFALVKTRQEAKAEHLLQRIGKACDSKLLRSEAKLTTLKSQISNFKTQIMESQQHRLQLLEQRTASLDPQLILNRGYSLTLLHGKAVRDAAALQAGNEIETRLSKGTIKSIVK